jgi:Cu2+-exporting ATPase
METSTIEAGERLSTLSAAGVQRQLLMLPGVHHADVNCVAGSATVHCDEATTTLDAIRQGVVDCGCHGRSELAPAHVCEPTDHRTASAAHAAHAGHARHADHSMPGGAHGASGALSPDQQAAMLHDMGHPTGLSMQGMADDMRNRFLVLLVFAVPVIPYSPMGEMAGNLPTPFGMDRKRFLFFAATAAIAHPVWPFVPSAVRAARNKVANRATLIVLQVGTGYLFGVGATFFYQSEVFFEDGDDIRRRRDTLLAVAAAAETFSEHPLAPQIATLSMSGSSAVVAIKPPRLKRTQPAGINRAGSPGALALAMGLTAGAST